MFGCQGVRDSLRKSGSSLYYDGPQSDHRGLFIDLDLRSLLGYAPSPLLLASSSARLLKAGNPELVSTYVDSMNTYYAAHDMCSSRIDRLCEDFSTMTRAAIHQSLEAWDADQGWAMKAAENSLRKPSCQYQWSPALRDAGIIRQYWKLHLKDALLSTDHSLRILRLESQIVQHEPSFVFPYRDETLSLVDIRVHLNKSTKTLRKVQCASEGHHQTNLYDLLARYYQSGQSSLPPNEARCRASVVRRTLTTEACRGMYANIRQQTKPEERLGLQHVNVPAETVAQGSSAYHYLQQSNPSNILWEKVVDCKAIETQIL
jgi:hypothetical protein